MKRIKKNIIVGLLLLCAASLLTGCSQTLLFDPKGPVGESERWIIIISFVLMMIVVIPVYVMVVWFPWKYRASNTEAEYDPKWSHSTKIEFFIWLVPAIIITLLSIILWRSTHQLDPYKPIESAAQPIVIEAVSMDWKWLFIYPDEQIATVNEIVFPVHVPLSFKITSDTVMTSFFIPQLGSQIYAMAGMQTKLHLLADETGTFVGQNQQFSGDGYSEMQFKAISVSREEFDAWLEKVRQASEVLDTARYEKLTEPSIGDPVKHFSSVNPGLFGHIMGKYSHGMDMGSGTMKMQHESGEMNSMIPEKH